MTAIGFDLNLVTWIVGIVLAIAFVVAVFALDLYKWIIIIATSILGAEVIVGTFLFIFGKQSAQFVQNPMKALNDSPGWWLVGLVIAVLGFVAQYQSTRNWTLKSYNRWEEVYSADDTPVMETSSGGLTPAMAGAAAASGPMPAPPPPAPVQAADIPPADVPPAVESSGEPPADPSA